MRVLRPALTHLPGDHAELFCRQVVEGEDIPPVEVAISIQRPVVDVSLLLVLFHAWHPAARGKIITVLLFLWWSCSHFPDNLVLILSLSMALHNLGTKVLLGNLTLWSMTTLLIFIRYNRSCNRVSIWCHSQVCPTPIPFDVDVAHVLSGDAGLIQSNIGGVPNDDSQEIPDQMDTTISDALTFKCYVPEFSRKIGYSLSRSSNCY